MTESRVLTWKTKILESFCKNGNWVFGKGQQNLKECLIFPNFLSLLTIVQRLNFTQTVQISPQRTNMSLYPFISDIWRLSENWLFLFLWVIKDQTVLSMPSRKTSMDKLLKSGCSIIEFPQHAILNPIMKQSSQMILVLIWSELYRGAL